MNHERIPSNDGKIVMREPQFKVHHTFTNQLDPRLYVSKSNELSLLRQAVQTPQSRVVEPFVSINTTFDVPSMGFSRQPIRPFMKLTPRSKDLILVHQFE